MKPEDRIHRSHPHGAAPKSAGDRPPLLLKHLGKGARVRLVCGACAWSKTYDPYRLIARLKETGAGHEATAIAHVARHIQWPCPTCGRMAWATQPDWSEPSASTSPVAAATGGGGPRPAEGVVEGEAPQPAHPGEGRDPS